MAFSFDEVTDDVSQSFKGFKFNKGTLLIIGVGIVLLMVFFRSRGNQTQRVEPETIPDVEMQGYPTMNQDDINSTFANYSTAVLDQVNSTLDDFHTDIMESVGEVQQETYEYVDDVRNGIEQQLGTDPETVEKKNSAGWTVGFGTTPGVSGNPNEGVNFATNREALKEEIDRTNAVIKYRTEHGMDITAQTGWLNKLRTL